MKVTCKVCNGTKEYHDSIIYFRKVPCHACKDEDKKQSESVLIQSVYPGKDGIGPDVTIKDIE